MLTNIIEALILAAAKGIEYSEIRDAFREDWTEREIKAALESLRAKYSDPSGIILIKFNSTYQFRSNPRYGETLNDILRPIRERQLSRTSLQTLAIVAYRQPVTRAEIEEMRDGISSDYALSVLVRAELIAPAGRKNAPGRPILYATTDEFLKRFGLESLSDLPEYEKFVNELDLSKRYNRTADDIYQIKNVNPCASADFFEPDDDDADFLADDDTIEIRSDIPLESSDASLESLSDAPSDPQADIPVAPDSQTESRLGIFPR